MTVEELENLLNQHDENAKRFGLSGRHAASLVVNRARAPQGHAVQTPFGRCTILNVQEKDGQFQICFAVSRMQLIRTIFRMKRASAA